jgi:hypothetical protein
MPGGSRSLPGRPSLRHLKLEAKRRLAVTGYNLTLDGVFETIPARVSALQAVAGSAWAGSSPRAATSPATRAPTSTPPRP